MLQPLHDAPAHIVSSHMGVLRLGLGFCMGFRMGLPMDLRMRLRMRLRMGFRRGFRKMGLPHS